MNLKVDDVKVVCSYILLLLLLRNNFFWPVYLAYPAAFFLIYCNHLSVRYYCHIAILKTKVPMISIQKRIIG